MHHVYNCAGWCCNKYQYAISIIWQDLTPLIQQEESESTEYQDYVFNHSREKNKLCKKLQITTVTENDYKPTLIAHAYITHFFYTLIVQHVQPQQHFLPFILHICQIHFTIFVLITNVLIAGCTTYCSCIHSTCTFSILVYSYT